MRKRRSVPPSASPAQSVTELAIEIELAALREIRRHARASMHNEVCGVLIGSETEDCVVVEACIEGARSAHGNTHVTFTQDTWEHIYAIKDKDYPDQRIVGWYHSHPGFGIFLSDHDKFIQKHFFSSPGQIAWVYDPHSDEEGCFGWSDGKIQRLRHWRIRDLGGGKPGPAPGERIPSEEDTPDEEVRPDRMSPIARRIFFALSYLAVLGLGFILAFVYLFMTAK